jgi:hypothetical protein
VPRVPDEFLNATLYLYGSLAEAQRGQNPGGTGFVVGRRVSNDENVWVLYAVTNWHVAVRAGASVIRLNTNDGKVKIIELDPADWVFRPSWHDLAAIAIPRSDNDQELDLAFIAEEMLATDAIVSHRDIGPGDDVFMVGLFVDVQGTEVNKPALRFGNISMMPVAFSNAMGVRMPSYCVDMHSRTGFSGSPVWVYRKAANSLQNFGINLGDQFLYMLGVHWGQFSEEWDIEQRAINTVEISSVPQATRTFVRGMSGMSCVVPASAVTELLNDSKLTRFMQLAMSEVSGRESSPIAE